MEGFVQIKAEVPRELTRRTLAALALREEKFARWLRAQMEAYVQQAEGRAEDKNDERLVGSQARS
jgi:hypothetical protein